ncbi:Carboxypeptidase S1 [Golovinomyces cichoracearum]|uniref:Carboxypeptidase n=1 Tax=Golovinomyces cichoracearum TaxID=62708 RepID=A0A420J4X7_9PEZI|nr:Carboxypeptidase S1 [Golovinomyces cichoracearum]
MFILTLVYLLASIATLQAKEIPAYLRGKSSSYEENGLDRTVFVHEATGAKIDYVTNSGICETTAGVNQYSGYLSDSDDENIWFWFFEARNNPTTAPVVVWLNGGPGCSSMIGLFQENGPCHFEDGSNEPSLNPYSWNEFANMLYIDQPIAVGFSHGRDNVSSTVSAAPLVWKLIQAFYAQFPQYENRALGIFTESYGGHYGPQFATYFQSQNEAVSSGKTTGQNIDLKVLAINNGWFEATIQQKALIDYSLNNTYRPLISSDEYKSYLDAFNSDCLPKLLTCTATTGQDVSCYEADRACSRSVEQPLIASGDFNIYDIRAPRDDPHPPSTYLKYLNTTEVVNAIGARSIYTECATDTYVRFARTGDIVQSGVKTLLWAGDADLICNWFGVISVAESIDYPDAKAFKSRPVDNYLVKGKSVGEFKTAGNLSWLRVYNAGHEVPYYSPESALQVLRQMFGEGLSST